MNNDYVYISHLAILEISITDIPNLPMLNTYIQQSQAKHITIE